MKKQKHF